MRFPCLLSRVVARRCVRNRKSSLTSLLVAIQCSGLTYKNGDQSRQSSPRCMTRKITSAESAPIRIASTIAASHLPRDMTAVRSPRLRFDWTLSAPQFRCLHPFFFFWRSYLFERLPKVDAGTAHLRMPRLVLRT